MEHLILLSKYSYFCTLNISISHPPTLGLAFWFGHATILKSSSSLFSSAEPEIHPTLLYWIWSLIFLSSDVFNLVSGSNVFSLLARREISPRTKHVAKWHWGEATKSKSGSYSRPKNEVARDARRGLLSWYLQFFSLKLSWWKSKPLENVEFLLLSSRKVNFED